MAQQISLKELGTVVLSSCGVRAVLHVPGAATSTQDLVWVATDDQRILFYSAADPERGTELGRAVVSADIVSMAHSCGQVWVGLSSGALAIFRRSAATGAWDTAAPATLQLCPGPRPVAALLPAPGGLVYTGAGRRVLVLDSTATVVRSFALQPQDGADIGHMAVAGVGLWVAGAASSVISLYHTETFIHMRDIDIAASVTKVLANKRSIFVTALSAAKGLLWVGTNVGIALTIPLPRLEGVPIISGKANISYHAHFGPVRMFLPLQQKVVTSEPVMARRPTAQQLPDADTASPAAGGSARPPAYRKQMSESGISSMSSSGSATPQLSKQVSSPVLRSRSVTSRDLVPPSRKPSKTLPRGFTLGPGSESSGDSVFGLYGDLMNVENYECSSTNNLDTSSKDVHNSDPELDTIPYRIGTLDRRVAFKSNRPRSLDLSSWSVESKGSSQTTSSSDGSQKTSPSVSRTASCASDSVTSESSWSSSKTTGSSGTKTKTLTQDNQGQGQGGKDASKAKHETVQRTVTTLMGGRGYIQWRHAHTERHRTSHLAQVNNSDAYLVIWDHKL